MRGKAVCFDMDGVLVDTMPLHVKAWKKSFLNKGHIIDEQLFYEREGMPGMQTILDIAKQEKLEFSENEAKEIYQEKRKHFKDQGSYSFIENSLNSVKFFREQQIPIALVTGSRKEFADEVLKQLPYDFEKVVTGDDVEHGKPHPEPYEKVMRAFSYEPNEWIVVENAPLGIRSAKEAGAFVIAIETTLPKEHLLGADLVLAPDELLSTIQTFFKKEEER